jgi:hypothetical protein
VLLARPHRHIGFETVNDLDAYLTNFWRALKCDPKGTAKHADWPMSEVDLLARHRWLLNNAPALLERLKTDPEYYDVKIAGWWIWGLNAWFGSGWCDSRPDAHLSKAGTSTSVKMPALGSARGTFALKCSNIESYFEALSTRLKKVRVTCGDWKRICAPSVTTFHGVTGVFLDPPYTKGDVQYSAGGCGGEVADEVREWAIANGDNRLLRIALCGYKGEHEMPDGWKAVPWNARKGMQIKKEAVADRKLETTWFSRHCINNRLL